MAPPFPTRRSSDLLGRQPVDYPIRRKHHRIPLQEPFELAAVLRRVRNADVLLRHRRGARKHALDARPDVRLALDLPVLSIMRDGAVAVQNDCLPINANISGLPRSCGRFAGFRPHSVVVSSTTPLTS